MCKIVLMYVVNATVSYQLLTAEAKSLAYQPTVESIYCIKMQSQGACRGQRPKMDVGSVQLSCKELQFLIFSKLEAHVGGECLMLEYSSVVVNAINS